MSDAKKSPYDMTLAELGVTTPEQVKELFALVREEFDQDVAAYDKKRMEEKQK